eukprot:gene37245-48690_t
MDQMAAIHNDVSKFIQSDAKNSYTMLKNEIEERARGCNDNCASVIKELQSVINKATKESSDVIESYLSRSQDMFQHLSHLLILKSFASHLSPQWIACYDDRLDAIISVLEDLRAEVFDENAFYVDKATSPHTVTLFPKVFGRGLDFVCRDNAVDAAAGG